MRLKLDENMPVELKDELVAQGHDTHTCQDEGINAVSDQIVSRAANSENRVLVTFDLDFADIRLYPPGTHPGIVVFRLSASDVDSCVAAMARMVFHIPEADVVGNLIIVEDDRVRIRRTGP